MDNNSKVKLYDHGLSPERPLSVEYFGNGKSIPINNADMHPAAHIGLILSGSLTGWIDGATLEFTSGGGWLVSPLEPHTGVKTSPDLEAIVITFIISELGNNLSGWNIPFLKPLFLNVNSRHKRFANANSKELLRLAEDIKYILQEDDNCKEFRLWLKLHEIMVVILGILGEDCLDNDTDLERLKNALMLPRAKRGVPISLQEAAKSCNLSTGRFCELFRKCTGSSFGQYEMRYRLSGARNDVINSLQSFQQIAEKWGFYDESHFLRLFKKFYDSTPGKYRKQKS